MINNRISLDETWEFQFESQFDADATPQGEWRSILVPRPWQVQDVTAQALFDEMLKLL